MSGRDPEKRAAQRLKDRERARSRAADPTSDIHGTLPGYVTGGCRCDECRDAYSTYTTRRRAQTGERIRAVEATWREMRLAELQADASHSSHGTLTGYGVGCRCFRCVDAQAEWKHQKKYGYDGRSAD